MSNESLRLNCLVYGDENPRQSIFTVDIARDKTVGDLKKAIKTEKQPVLDHRATDQLVLWKDSDGRLEEELGENPFDGGRFKKLLPLDDLAEVFVDQPPRKQLHILVQVLYFNFLSDTLKRPRSLSSPASSNEVKRLRTGAIPSQFIKLQSKAEEPFAYCNRPDSASSIPVTLLHPIFGRFIDDSHTYAPTKEDNSFVLELSAAMSGVFRDEAARRDEFIAILSRHYKIQLVAGEIGGTGYKTDDCLAGGYTALVSVAKNELGGSADAEPYFQGCLYYRASVKQSDADDSMSVLPCFQLFYCGACFGFAGLAFTDRPHLDLLGPIIPLFYQRHDIALRETAARFFGAFKNAIFALHQYYEIELPALRALDPSSRPQPLYPYQSNYMPLSGSSAVRNSRYARQLSVAERHRLIFYGETVEPVGTKLCIKFVRRYSKDAHLFCAANGYAPALYGFEELPGDWCMVVMEDIDPHIYRPYDDIRFTFSEQQRQHLRHEFLRCIRTLHNAEMVHGDIRDANLLVRVDGTFGFKILDFDWAGRVGVVRYPINVNHHGISRPVTASDGELVTVEHDLAMVDFMIPSAG